MLSPHPHPLIPWRVVQGAIWLLPASGVIGAIIYSYWMTTPDPESDLAGFADWVSTATAIATGLLYVLAVTALIFGLLAVYSLLADGRSGTWALAGLVASVVGVGMILSALGAFIFAGSDIGDLYVDGEQGVGPALTILSGGNFGPAINLVFNVGIAASLIGALALGAALWRSKLVSRWAAVAFAAGFVLFLSSTPVLAQVGGVLLAIAGVMIARSLARMERVSMEPQPVEPRPARAA